MKKVIILIFSILLNTVKYQLEETDIINLSPLLSDYYKIIPRKENKEENLFYSFNETKLAIIQFENGNLILKENDIIICESTKDNCKKTFEFKKDEKYNIIYYNSSTTLHIHFYENHSLFLKHDINKRPILLFNGFKNYIFQIDISNYEIGEYIIFELYSDGFIDIKYQYKNDFKQNNFINLGEYSSHFNYILINKTKNDSSLLLKIKYPSYSFSFNIINIYKQKITEINSDYTENFKGPKLFLIDYYTFNNYKSFGIESNQKYFLFEQIYDTRISFEKTEYNNITITKQNNDNSQLFKRAFIFFNTTENIYFKVQKFNFSILQIYFSSYKPLKYEYFQLCQDKDTNKELYFYIEISNEIFIPIFGNYDSFFIYEEEIKNLSDLDFNKINETHFAHNVYGKGFLKIKCQNPIMLKYIYTYTNYDYIYFPSFFLSGFSYFINYYYLDDDYNLDTDLVNKVINKTIPFIPLKFSLFGIKQNYSIELILDNKTYELNNSKPLEIEYICETNNCGFIKFNAGDNIEKTMIIEVIVGNINENLEKYDQIDFIDSLGKLDIKKRGTIIKVPKDLNEELYDFNILVDYDDYYDGRDYYDIHISYDRIEFIVPNYEVYYYTREFNYPNSGCLYIPLFNTNPYLSISKEEQESNNKFFYILIYNLHHRDLTVFIKKPKLFSDININKINKLPQLKGEEEKYYYKINFPKGDYNFLLVQSSGYYYRMTINNDLHRYQYLFYYYYTYNILIDKNDIMNNNLYLNYYDTDSADIYINFIPRKEFFPYNDYDYSFKYNMTIDQIKGENKLKLKFISYSYFFFQQPINYYILINSEDKDTYRYNMNNIYSIIGEYKSLDKDKNQTMIILEDNGEKEIVEFEIEIKDKLSENNKLIIVPINKDFYIDTNFIEYKYFNFEYIVSYNNTLIFILIIVGAILLLFIIICVIYCLMRKRRKNNDLSEKIINNDLQPIESSD